MKRTDRSVVVRAGGVACCLFMVLVPGETPGSAAILNVPGEYPTIQSAIDAAGNGDTVNVAAGRYYECLTWASKSIALVGAGAEFTTVDAVGLGRCLTMTGVPATAWVEGFTFTGGSYPSGGGLYLSNSSPLLTGNTISGNFATGYDGAGGGIYVLNSSPTLTGNRITGNSATGYYGYAGGLYMTRSSATLFDNTISGNSARTWGGGLHASQSFVVLTRNTIANNSGDGSGGVVVIDFSSAAFEGNTIEANTTTGGYGGGLFMRYSSATLTNNAIVGNFGRIGGGMGLQYWSSPTMVGNTISRNGALVGGGIYAWWQCSPTLEGNAITDNSASSGGGGLLLDTSSATLRKNTILRNNSGLGAGGVGLWKSSLTLTENTIEGNYAYMEGAGVSLAKGSSGTLINNIIASNSATWAGGVYVDDSSATLTGNTISGNTARAWAGGVEAGSSSLTLTDNVISGNSAVYGGTAVNVSGSWGTLSNNTISGNYASRWGGALRIADSSPTVSGNTITDNGASWEAGAVYVVFGSSPVMTGNIIARNSTPGRGGGLYIVSSSPVLRDNTITDNSAGRGGGGVHLETSSGELANNTITSNARDGVQCVGSSPTICGNEIAKNAANGIRIEVLYGSGGDPAQAHLDVLSEPNIKGNTVSDNGEWGITCDDTAAANAASIHGDNTLGTNGKGQVVQWWYGLVRVLESDGSPAAGASVWLYNNDGDATADYGSPFIAQADGYAPPWSHPAYCFSWPRITQFEVLNDSILKAYTPHTIAASLGEMRGSLIHCWNGRYEIAEVRIGVNSAPVANAGPDQTLEQTRAAGTHVTLDGSDSSDADGDPLTYTWTGPFPEGGGTVHGVNPTVTLPLGTSTITLVVNDGKVHSEPDRVEVTVTDTTKPSLLVQVDGIAVNDWDTAEREQTALLGHRFSINATASDICDADLTLTLSIDGEDATPAAWPSVVDLQLGQHTAVVTATDESGNTASVTVGLNVVDTREPSLMAPPDVAAEQTEQGGAPKDQVNLGVPIVSDICDTDPVVTNDAPAVFPLGETTVTWTATDDSGNAATATQKVTIVDRAPPLITVPAEITVQQESSGGTVVTFTCRATDICDADLVVVCVPPSGTEFPLGTTVVTCTATDASGNPATATFRVTVKDTTPPQAAIAAKSLWPPNHDLVDAGLSIQDICDADPTVGLSVTQDEPVEDQTGDGNFSPDAKILRDTNGKVVGLRLRAERKGDGDGRVYLIIATVTDASGNALKKVVAVTVPKSQSKKDLDAVAAGAPLAHDSTAGPAIGPKQ